MYCDQPAFPAQGCRRQGGDDSACLEFERSASAVGLGGNNQVVIGAIGAAARAYGVEQEFMVFPVDRQHYRPFVYKAAAPPLAHSPMLGEQRLQFGNLDLKIVRRPAEEWQIVPDKLLVAAPTEAGVSHGASE